jgi:rubredoxin
MKEPNQWWMCSECNNLFQAEMVPQVCPSCQKKCTFANITCYIPECGGPNNLDVRLVQARIEEAKKNK